MAVTFNPSLTLERDRIRFAIAQTGSDSLIQDETIDALISGASSIQQAAAQAAMHLASVFAGRASESAAGDQKVKFDGRAEHFRQLAADILAGVVLIPGAALLPTASMGSLVEPDLTRYRP